MKIGYARVSRYDQNLSLQLAALEKAECERIFTDKMRGKTITRHGLSAALEFLRKGDTLCVWKLDRLGRSVRDIVNLSAQFNNDGIELISLKDSIDTTTPIGRLYFHIVIAFAQLEREVISERTIAGLQEAKKRGKKLGRPDPLTTKEKVQVMNLLKTGMSYRHVAETFKVSKTYLYKNFPVSNFNTT